jgi:hypothetical protein
LGGVVVRRADISGPKPGGVIICSVVVGKVVVVEVVVESSTGGMVVVAKTLESLDEADAKLLLSVAAFSIVVSSLLAIPVATGLPLSLGILATVELSLLSPIPLVAALLLSLGMLPAVELSPLSFIPAAAVIASDAATGSVCASVCDINITKSIVKKALTIVLLKLCSMIVISKKETSYYYERIYQNIMNIGYFVLQWIDV